MTGMSRVEVKKNLYESIPSSISKEIFVEKNLFSTILNQLFLVSIRLDILKSNF